MEQRTQGNVVSKKNGLRTGHFLWTLFFGNVSRDLFFAEQETRASVGEGQKQGQVWEKGRSHSTTDCGVRLLTTDLVGKHSHIIFEESALIFFVLPHAVQRASSFLAHDHDASPHCSVCAAWRGVEFIRTTVV